MQKIKPLLPHLNQQKLPGFYFVAVIFAVCLLRYLWAPSMNIDMVNYNLKWVAFIKEHGWQSYGFDFTNYTPFYGYLLGLFVGLLPDLQPLMTVKLLSNLTDVVGALVIYRMLRLHYADAYIPRAAAIILFCLPTIIVNSAYMGQIDMLHTIFLLGMVYYAATHKPLLTIVCFGLAVSIKLQAIFLAPFIFILMLNKKMPWHYMFVVPLCYIVTIIPCYLLGRDLNSLLTIYFSQFGTFHRLSMNAPSIYSFVPNSLYDALKFWGTVFAGVVMIVLSFVVNKKQKKYELKDLVLLATIIGILSPFLLPKMHERYFYQADVLSLVLAFLEPRLWFVPLLEQAASGVSYIPFNFSVAGTPFIQLGAYINFICLAILIKFWWKKQKATN